MNDRVIASEGAYSIEEIDILKSLFDRIIPASADNRFPSAADPLIFEDFLASSGRFREMISTAILLLQELSGADYCELSEADADRVTQQFYGNRTGPVTTLLSLLAQCYYRDDRVLEAIGLEPRAPFPKGFEVENGDWELLEPVKNRGPIYRMVES